MAPQQQMRPHAVLAGLALVLLVAVHSARAATFVVAASNSPPAARARADVVCNGTNDQEVLAASLKTGVWTKTEYDDNAWTFAYSGQSVEWLAGDYYLSDTLFLPQSVDSVLHAEGAILHHTAGTGDAVVITGSLRCTFRFGSIWTGSQDGAALALKDRPYSNPFMPNLMSVISFQGLQHVPPDGTHGVGLWLTKHFCVNKVEGTDVRGFSIGVLVDDAFGGGEGKIDTNWYWLSYVRGCAQDIVVTGNGVDSQQWRVNVDATLPGSVAIRTAARFERWYIIMGTLDRSPNTRSIILEPGADSNWFYITPPLWMFDGYENHSGTDTNVFVQLPQNPPQRSHGRSQREKRHQHQSTASGLSATGTVEPANIQSSDGDSASASNDATHLVLQFAPFDDGPGYAHAPFDL